MKVYHTLDLGEYCNICGVNDNSPLKIARTTTDKVLDNERLHSHLKGFEYYLIMQGALRMRVGASTLELKAGDMLQVDPGEPHKVEEVLQRCDYVVVNTNPDPLDRIVLE